MTTGEILQKKLKLSHLECIILKVVGFPVSLYYIFYNSRQTFPMTLPWIQKAMKQNYINIFNINLKKFVYTPPLDLKKFNGDITNSRFIICDIEGIWFQDLSKFKESTNFDLWFKGSKVVDKNGIPLIVYHGTQDMIFTEFDLNKTGSSTDTGMYGKGFYFTDSKNEAIRYSRGGRLIAVYLSMKRPYYIKNKTDIPKINVPNKTMEDLKNADKNYSILFTNFLKSKGYDGVIDKTSLPYQYIVFDSSQIKFIDSMDLNNLKEALVWGNLIKNRGVSPFTNFYRQERKTLGNTVNRIRFVGTEIINDNDVDLNFFIKATIFKKDSEGTIVGQKYPDKKELVPRTNDKKMFDVQNRKMLDNNDKIYHVTFRLKDFIKTYKVLYGENIVKNEDIKKIIMNSYVQINSDNPAWYWQGAAYNCKTFGGTISTKSIRAPKVWTSKRHGSIFYFLDKDSQDLVNNIHVFMNSICANIKSKLRVMGFK